MTALVAVAVGLTIALGLTAWRLRSAHARVAAVQARLAAMLESLSAGLAVWSADGRLRACNGRFREFYPGVPIKPGLMFEDLIRFNATRAVVLVPEDSLEEWVSVWTARLGTDSCETLRTPDDRWLEVRTVATAGGETVLLYIDVTDRRASTAAITDDRIRAEHQSAGLALLEQAVAVGAAATSFHAAARDVLGLVATWARWPAGTLYLVAADETRAPSASGVWYVGDDAAAAALRAAVDACGDDPDDGLLQRAVRSGEPTWVTNIDVDPRLSDRRRRALAGVRGLCAIPVKAGSRVVAVLEFFAFDQLLPDPSAARLVTRVSDQLARVFERERV